MKLPLRGCCILYCNVFQCISICFPYVQQIPKKVKASENFSLAFACPSFNTVLRLSRNFSLMVNQEEKAAQRNAAAAALTEANDTIFGKIVRGEIPCRKVYEDSKCLAFHDVNPQAPVHIILIPKEPNGLTRLSRAEDFHQDILGHLMTTVAKIAKQEDLGDFRVVINDGPGAAQSVYHLHLHILAKRQFHWPPG